MQAFVPPREENVPSGHGMQMDLELAPTTKEYVPGGQIRQSSGDIELNMFENVPAGQKTHAVNPAAVE